MSEIAARTTVDQLHNFAPGTLRLIDIRKVPDDKRIPGSTRAAGTEVESDPERFASQEPVVLYCGSGNSCSRIADALRERGYINVSALEGGYAAWRDAGLPLEPSDAPQ